MVALRRSREEEEPLRWFESVERFDTIHCEWCMPYQNDSAVHIARGLKVSVEQFWLETKRFM